MANVQKVRAVTLREDEILEINRRLTSKSSLIMFLYLRCIGGEVRINSAKFGEILGVSRQTISRALQDLEEAGLITLDVVEASMRLKVKEEE